MGEEERKVEAVKIEEGESLSLWRLEALLFDNGRDDVGGDDSGDDKGGVGEELDIGWEEGNEELVRSKCGWGGVGEEEEDKVAWREEWSMKF